MAESETMHIEVATSNNSLTVAGPDGSFVRFKRGRPHQVSAEFGRKLVASGRFKVVAPEAKRDTAHEDAVKALVDRLMGSSAAGVRKLSALLDAVDADDAPETPAPKPAAQPKAATAVETESAPAAPAEEPPATPTTAAPQSTDAQPPAPARTLASRNKRRK